MTAYIDTCELTLNIPFGGQQVTIRVEGTQDLIVDLIDKADRAGTRIIPVNIWSPSRRLWAEHWIAIDKVALVGPTKFLTVQGDEVSPEPTEGGSNA